MLINCSVIYNKQECSLGSVDLLVPKTEVNFFKEHVIELMQRGANFGLVNREEITGLREDIFSIDNGKKMLSDYVRDHYDSIKEQYGWEKLGWISEFRDMVIDLDDRVSDGFYMIYGSIRGKKPEDCNSLSYSSILSNSWKLLRKEIKDDIISLWLDGHWDEAKACLGKMRIPPSFEEDDYVGASYRELFKAYNRRLENI